MRRPSSPSNSTSPSSSPLHPGWDRQSQIRTASSDSQWRNWTTSSDRSLLDVVNDPSPSVPTPADPTRRCDYSPNSPFQYQKPPFLSPPAPGATLVPLLSDPDLGPRFASPPHQPPRPSPPRRPSLLLRQKQHSFPPPARSSHRWKDASSPFQSPALEDHELEWTSIVPPPCDSSPRESLQSSRPLPNSGRRGASESVRRSQNSGVEQRKPPYFRPRAASISTTDELRPLLSWTQAEETGVPSCGATRGGSIVEGQRGSLPSLRSLLEISGHPGPSPASMELDQPWDSKDQWATKDQLNTQLPNLHRFSSLQVSLRSSNSCRPSLIHACSSHRRSLWRTFKSLPPPPSSPFFPLSASSPQPLRPRHPRLHSSLMPPTTPGPLSIPTPPTTSAQTDR